MERERCTNCGKPLGRRIVWLELDQRDGTYHWSRDVPDEFSQGWFPFGLDCAARLEVAAALSTGE